MTFQTIVANQCRVGMAVHEARVLRLQSLAALPGQLRGEASEGVGQPGKSG